ncbi:MAG TPA: NADH-quinone oxidoreductase subunit NuoH, partial [Phycisphaerae bacterium]|nr:NADH-quinone oxidoreductase subunit NuoH [Phycisphaerae bacterium]
MTGWLRTQAGFSVAVMVIALLVLLTTVAYCIYIERKIAAFIQDRLGPNRVGPRGLLQPLADGLKFILKEDIIPAGVDRPLFVLAPMIIFMASFITFAVIPWGGPIRFADGSQVNVQVASLDVGLLYILAVASVGVYGIVLGGWASNNKYSFYGALRAAAQMLSYEIPMGLAILVAVLTAGELRLERIVEEQIGGGQGGVWIGLLHPLACVMFLVTSLAESNRLPFDLAEAEQELVGGYHTEYSAMKFGLFFLAEYAGMIVNGALVATLFLGGWELFPFSGRLGWGWVDWINRSPFWPAAVVRCAIVYAKVMFFIVLAMWIRWTLPRFRFDQLMRLAWKALV